VSPFLFSGGGVVICGLGRKTAGNFKREINMSFCHKPSKRQIKSNGWQIKDLSRPLLAFCRDSSGFQGKKNGRGERIPALSFANSLFQ